MTGNPRSSPWRNTPRAKRRRRPIEITLSDEARAALDALAPHGRRSELVERLVLEELARAG